MRNTENSIAWLEAALAENLRPVNAPAQLWDRVQLPRVEARRTGRQGWLMPGHLALTSAVAATLVLGLWGFGRASQDFRSSDPSAIRAWVQDRCGFALPLSAEASPKIRLSDVRLNKSFGKGDAAADLAFNVEGRPALLQVSRAGSASAGEAHHQLAAGTKSVSWVSEGRLFTLACATPDDLRIACSLCHVAGAL